ncbi:3-oxoacyl-[acyl-carrier-protein] synthase II [Glycomyces sambucus]|uniref:3-oxoacyl-[acyl-carrier-protein] synthase II n=1 Tax=Glycomyces sambucus TaxID=380244 RepID=A0A1G9CD78_9ACTN|nr:beta-ketoacyl-[acyl-carrier-protein] synthase family protein [Glycomyces sambucus]SDK49609.1 3-oxoacyl-[acyl-carrier-protein] synthase II [Glycomyces sambucus]
MKQRTVDHVVAVTGIGALAPGGIGARAFWDALFAVPRHRPVRSVEGFDPSMWLGFKDAKRLDRVSQMAVAAADEALRDAGLLAHPDAGPATPDGTALLAGIDPERTAVSLGTGIGGVATLEAQMGVRERRGNRLVSPFTVPMTMPNAPAAALSLRYGLRGSAQTITTACASATDAIAAGARLIAEGRADLVVTGGADHSLTPTCIAGFRNMRALSPTGVSRPFDTGRDGLAASESAGVLVLEPLAAALDRGARVYMTVLGAGSSSDAHHITSPAPHGAGALRCMTEALDDADLRPGDIAHVNAHGTSTPAGDLAEAQALAALFGAHRPPVTSIKGVTGHSFGAAGGIEAVAVALTIAGRTLPPTIGHERAGEGIEADIVTAPRDWTPGPVISNSFGFGGHNASVVFGPAPAA